MDSHQKRVRVQLRVVLVIRALHVRQRARGRTPAPRRRGVRTAAVAAQGGAEKQTEGGQVREKVRKNCEKGGACEVKTRTEENERAGAEVAVR